MLILEWLFAPLYLFVPAFVANICPGFSAMIPGDKSISERWLGGNKTWYGLVSSTLGGVMVVWIQHHVSSLEWTQSLSLYNYAGDSWWLLGILLGLGAIVGDWLESFFKRRFGLKPGEKCFFDQIDFLIGAYVLTLPLMGFLPWNTYVVPLVTILVFHQPLNNWSYRRGLRKTPW